MRAEAQNLKNSVEYFKIDSAKERWRLQVALEAMAVNEGTRVAQKTIFDLKQYFFREKIYFSCGLQQNTRQNYECSSDSDFAAHLLSLEYWR